MIEVFNVKCEDGIPTLKDNSVDLVITSPPYNVDLGNNAYYKNAYDLYNDNKDHQTYINWLKDIFGGFYTKMKVGGRICINIGDGKNGVIPTHSDIIQFMTKDLNYILMANIIWDKSQHGNRCAWGSWLSPSSPSFPTPYEYIMVFAKESKKLQEEGETDLTKQEFIDWSLATWRITPETRMNKIGHPAMFPEEIPFRLIKMLSWKNALVVDPFNGAGTTAIVSKRLGRDYIGFEISKEYCDITEKRLKNQLPLDEIDLFA